MLPPRWASGVGVRGKTQLASSFASADCCAARRLRLRALMLFTFAFTFFRRRRRRRRVWMCAHHFARLSVCLSVCLSAWLGAAA